MMKNNNEPKSSESNDELLSDEIGKELNPNGLPPDIKKLIAELKNLPPEKQRVVCRMTATEVFSGPIPSPAVLQGYEATLPGAADRILTLAEGEATHRRDMEKEVIRRDGNAQMLGLRSALAVALVAILGGIVAIIAGHPLAGTILSGGTIVTLVGAFIYGSQNKMIAQYKESPSED